MSFKWWSVLLPLYLFSQAFASAGELRVCQQDPSKYAYRIELSNLILVRTAERYGELHIARSGLADPPQDRCLAQLQAGMVDLVYVPPNAQRLRDFDMLPFDLHAGMLGYRLLLIRREDAGRFAAVRTLDDLRQLRGGFGSQWSDFPLFALNRLPVVGTSHPENLLAMLRERRFDYYHRAVHEAWQEVGEHPELHPQLMVEPTLALAYPLPVYFTFKHGNYDLKSRFEEGLALIQADGSFRELFTRHFGALLQSTRLAQRRVLLLRSDMGPTVAPADSYFWSRQ